jgi:ribonuclease P protein component
LIRRIRERRAFERLSRHGTRVRSASLWCSYLHDPELEAPHVAFAIGRAVGPAVVRNRLRRRIRTVLHELSRTGDLPTCWLSIGARATATELTFDQLRDEVRRMIRRIPAAPSTPSTPAATSSPDTSASTTATPSSGRG